MPKIKMKKIRKRMQRYAFYALPISFIFLILFAVSYYQAKKDYQAYVENSIRLINELQDEFNGLIDNMKENMNLLMENLENALEGAIAPPYVQIENRTVHMVFKASNGTLHQWTIGENVLEAQIQLGWYKREITHDVEYLNLTDNQTGETYRIMDYRPFIIENNFTEVITDLYHELGDNDEAFVHEVWYIVTQLTTYNSNTSEAPRFPFETLVGGGGDCKDLAVLEASMLKAVPANYVVDLVYMDSDNPTAPENVNHVTVWVETPSGYKTFVEGTEHVEMNPYTEVDGWYFQVQ
jgi:hypothetical protein